MTTAAGRGNMASGRGYDDPRFVQEMFKLYDAKYGTNNFDAENKYHGHIGFLEFKSEADMNKMIERAIEKANDGGK